MIGVLAVVTSMLQAVMQAPPQVSVRVEPESVSVGQPFEVAVVVRAPFFAKIAFPATPSVNAIELLDPVRISQRDGWDIRETTATYRLAAWDVGRFDIVFPPLRIHSLDVERDVAVPQRALFVVSVLPSDTSLHYPRPARDVFSGALPWWIWTLVIALLAAATVWLLARFHRKRPVQVRHEPDASVEALFDRIDTLGLFEVGEAGRHVVLAADALREALAREYPRLRTSLTSHELLGALPEELAALRPVLADLLRDIDSIKFAMAEVTPQRARELAQTARQLAIALREQRPSTREEAA
ncbi:MAG TPA: hypothetical protein VNL96_10860 [Gemmatimonadaceae bacterium]|nr:hypothetical protein [Gemmatimonadaceae bacterium]